MNLRELRSNLDAVARQLPDDAEVLVGEFGVEITGVSGDREAGIVRLSISPEDVFSVMCCDAMFATENEATEHECDYGSNDGLPRRIVHNPEAARGDIGQVAEDRAHDRTVRDASELGGQFAVNCCDLTFATPEGAIAHESPHQSWLNELASRENDTRHAQDAPAG